MSAELHRTFIAEARRRLSAIEEGRDDADREAHTLRGSAAVLGLADVEGLAAKLEEALAAGRSEDSRRLTEQIRALVDALADSHPAPADEPVPAPAGDRTVLYIEDSRSNALLVERTLRLRGIRMLDAHTGADGIRLAREERPGLVLLDLRLPDLDGASVFRRLQDDPATAGIPVVVVSGGVEPETADELRAGGVLAFLGKPFPLERLLALVDATLGTASEH
ncbi:MAG TPA: response regulator [Gaiellaceae bacterium]|nr:response regulator [Gaiellaceae bacterium]